MAEYLDLKLFMTHVGIENFVAEYDGVIGYAGMNNFYLYRYAGANKFRFLAWDKDVTFWAPDYSIWEFTNTNVLMRRALVYPELRDTYLETLYKAAQSAAKDEWLATEIERIYLQTRDVAYADTRKPFNNSQFDENVELLRKFARLRIPFVLDAVTRAGYFPPAEPVVE